MVMWVSYCERNLMYQYGKKNGGQGEGHPPVLGKSGFRLLGGWGRLTTSAHVSKNK